jgi:two-component system phosphate regulon response regulator PhoB
MQMSELREAGKPMTSKVRLLAVDDDAAIRTMLDRVLDGDGFQVEGAATVGEALSSFQRRPPDLVLLDVMLAGEDGLDLLIELRRTHNVPVILLTGRGDEADRVLGLRMGADDYVVKPFSIAELSARITSVLRRSAGQPEKALRSFGSLDIDANAREVRVGGALIETTAKEFDLLAFLSGSPRQVFTREQILEHVWDSSSNWQDPATVTEHVRRLRLKIEADPEQPKIIRTVRGVGYRFEP